MDKLLYCLARVLVACVQILPLTWVARLGRAGGALAYWLDARHRRVVLLNLAMCFGREKPPEEIRALARENFRRIGENYLCAVRSAADTKAEVRSYLEVVGTERIAPPPAGQNPHSLVLAIGHFGNFELNARLGQFIPYQVVTTYRSLPHPSVNRLLQSLREQTGCIYLERRTGAAALKSIMNQSGILLVLLADQRAGGSGIDLPLFGRACPTSTAPAVFARRYHCALHPAICYRVDLARWRIEIGPEIPTRNDGSSRSTEEITRDINRAYEAAIRHDPANWFWVHNRWKLTNAAAESRRTQT